MRSLSPSGPETIWDYLNDHFGVHFEPFLTHPAFRHVTWLDLDGLEGSEGPDLTPLAARRDLQRLTALTARADHQEGVRLEFGALWRSAALSNLRRLAITGNYTEDDYLALAKSPKLPRLQALEIGNHVGLMFFDGEQFVRAFASTPHFSDLR